MDWNKIILAVISALSIAANGGAVYNNHEVQQSRIEREEMGLFITRLTLLYRLEDGKLNDYQRGILHGLCRSLRISEEDCEKR